MKNPLIAGLALGVTLGAIAVYFMPSDSENMQANVFVNRTIRLSEAAQEKAKLMKESTAFRRSSARSAYSVMTVRKPIQNLEFTDITDERTIDVVVTETESTNNAPSPNTAPEAPTTVTVNAAPVPSVVPESASSTKRIEHYPNINVPQSVLETLISDPDIASYGALSPASLAAVQHNIDIPQLNNQGIRELIGVGVSDFAGSTAGRIHNIKHSATLFDGTVIPKESTFSFNQLLGPVRYETGFGDAKVIISGKAVTGIGGGVCQTSTTIFRAAYNSGLEIVNRRNHSFPVGYYGPTQGFDATIYPGVQDLEFKNNTPGDILLLTFTVGNKEISLMYGTKDRHVQTDFVGASGSWWTGINSQWQRSIMYFDEPDQWYTESLYSSYNPPKN